MSNKAKVFLVSVALLCGIRVQAQTYPVRPITIVVPLPPGGGGADTLTRILADRLKSLLGEPIVVENIVGAGGTIGVARVARAKADGYTLSMGSWVTHVAGSLVYPVQYDVLKDLIPISHLSDAPYWIVARKNLPASNLRELIDWLKLNPGKATVGTLGVGSGSHICTRYLQNAAGVEIQFVPYSGGPAAMQDLLAGRIDVMCDYAPNSLGNVRGGQIKALGVMAKHRWFASPDTLTVDEQGMAGIYFSSWLGLWAPKGTPSAITDKLSTSIGKALTDPAVRQKIANLGQEVAPPEEQQSSAFARLLKLEFEKWRPIIKAQ